MIKYKVGFLSNHPSASSVPDPLPLPLALPEEELDDDPARGVHDCVEHSQSSVLFASDVKVVPE